jgi:hypothetical protein
MVLLHDQHEVVEREDARELAYRVTGVGQVARLPEATPPGGRDGGGALPRGEGAGGGRGGAVLQHTPASEVDGMVVGVANRVHDLGFGTQRPLPATGKGTLGEQLLVGDRT